MINACEDRERREPRLVRRSFKPIFDSNRADREVGELTIQCTRNLLSQGSSVHQSAFFGLERHAIVLEWLCARVSKSNRAAASPLTKGRQVPASLGPFSSTSTKTIGSTFAALERFPLDAQGQRPIMTRVADRC